MAPRKEGFEMYISSQSRDGSSDVRGGKFRGSDEFKPKAKYKTNLMGRNLVSGEIVEG